MAAVTGASAAVIASVLGAGAAVVVSVSGTAEGAVTGVDSVVAVAAGAGVVSVVGLTASDMMTVMQIWSYLIPGAKKGWTGRMSVKL